MILFNGSAAQCDNKTINDNYYSTYYVISLAMLLVYYWHI